MDGIRLIPMTPEMYHLFFQEYENDPDLYLDPGKFVPYVYSKEKTERYIRRQQDLRRIPLAVMEGDRIAGEVILKKITPHECATMGITLKNAAFKGRGIGTQAERLAVRYVFEELDIPVLYADSLLTNKRSQHVLLKAGFRLVGEEGNFKYYEIRRENDPAPPAVTVKKMETEDEIRGKAFVHWSAWHEAYPGIVSAEYLEGLTLEKCEEMAFRWPERTIVALGGRRVIGFAGYGDRGAEAPERGEIFALYVHPEYYRKGIGRMLMEEALSKLQDYPEICLWVLKENERAIRFYEKCGFHKDGEEMFSPRVKAWEIRMIRRRPEVRLLT